MGVAEYVSYLSLKHSPPSPGGLTAVANLATDDGLTALLLNAGAYARPPKPPLHLRVEAADNSVFRR